MTNIVFSVYLLLGIIEPQGEVDGREIYSIHHKSTKIEYAYKAEIIQYLETGQFEYNEDL